MIHRRAVKMSFNDMPVGKLGIHIMEEQHPYLKRALSTFARCLVSISAGDANDPKTIILSDLLTQLGKLLEQHLQQDEQMLFPYLRAKISNRSYKTFDDLPFSYRSMKEEYIIIRKLFKKVRFLSNQYTPPQGSVAAIKLCYAQLFNFEQDMLKHIFLEENILLPKLMQ